MLTEPNLIDLTVPDIPLDKQLMDAHRRRWGIECLPCARPNPQVNKVKSPLLTSSPSRVSQESRCHHLPRAAEVGFPMGTPTPRLPIICLGLGHILGTGRRRRAEGKSQQWAQNGIWPQRMALGSRAHSCRREGRRIF